MYDAFKTNNSFKPLVECRLFNTICYIVSELSAKELPPQIGTPEYS